MRMVKSGLANHGWTYVNIDEFWENTRDSQDPTLQGPFRDADGFHRAERAFSGHEGSGGLRSRLGFEDRPYILRRGRGRAVGTRAATAMNGRTRETYAKWGFDYFKYDLCSSGSITEGKAATDKSISSWDAGKKGKSDAEVAAYPYRLMGKFLREQKRGNVFVSANPAMPSLVMGRIGRWQ